MTLVAEFLLAAAAFPLGRALDAGDPDRIVELERVVPTSGSVTPFFWASGGDAAAFERAVAAHPHVEELAVLARVDDATLYRVDWDATVEGFVTGVAAAGATILEARGSDVWRFRLRFEDHADLGVLHEYAVERGIEYELVRLSTRVDRPRDRYDLDLTDEQREALVLAASRGYFEVPRGVTLAELAAEIGITEQSLSERLRRGIGRTLATTVLDPVDDDTGRA